MLKATITAENLTSQTCIEKCGSCTAAMSQKLLRVRIYTQSSLGTFVSVVLCFNSIVFLILFGNDSTPFNEKNILKIDMGSKVSKTSAKQRTQIDSSIQGFWKPLNFSDPAVLPPTWCQSLMGFVCNLLFLGQSFHPGGNLWRGWVNGGK